MSCAVGRGRSHVDGETVPVGHKRKVKQPLCADLMSCVVLIITSTGCDVTLMQVHIFHNSLCKLTYTGPHMKINRFTIVSTHECECVRVFE